MLRRRNKRSHGKETLIIGIIFSALSFFAVSFLAALIISKTKKPGSLIGIASLAALLISGAISGILTSRYKGEGGVGYAALGSSVFSLILLSCGLIVNGGRIPLASILGILCFAVMASVFAAIGKRRTRRHSH